MRMGSRTSCVSRRGAPGLIARLRDFVRRRDPGRRTMAGLVQPPVGTRPTRAASSRRRPPPPNRRRPANCGTRPGSTKSCATGWPRACPRSSSTRKVRSRGTYRADIETAEGGLPGLPRGAGPNPARARCRSSAIKLLIVTRCRSAPGLREVHRPFRGAADDWEGVLHYHHDPQGKNVLTFRMPAPADIRAAIGECTGGRRSDENRVRRVSDPGRGSWTDCLYGPTRHEEGNRSYHNSICRSGRPACRPEVLEPGTISDRVHWSNIPR